MKTLGAIEAERTDQTTALKRHPGVIEAVGKVQDALDALTTALTGLDENWAALETAREGFRAAVSKSRLPISVEKAAAQLCKMEHTAPEGTSGRTLSEIASIHWK